MKVIEIPTRAECVECPFLGDYHSGAVDLATAEALEHFAHTGHYVRVFEASRP